MDISGNRSISTPGTDEGADSAHWRALTTWVQMLAKTIKTCRLYDGENPTVIRFREELARQLRFILQTHGVFRITFSSNDICWEERSLYPARSREDNLSQPFFRDGIRALTFHPGIEDGEVEAFVDQILLATGRQAGDEDLVTLLWSAHLPHVDIDYVPIDGNIDGIDGAGREKVAALIPPWPASGSGTASDSRADYALPAQAGNIPIPGTDPPAAGDLNRSDDWETREGTSDLSKVFRLFELRSEFEIDRFRWELDVDRELSSVRSALDLVRDCLGIEGEKTDRQDLALFLPRVLREAIREAAWDEARQAMDLLERSGVEEWTSKTLARELLGPYSVVTPKAIAALDRQNTKGIESFLNFARQFGAGGIEWLMTVLAESQQKQVRRPLTKIIAEVSSETPEKLSHWLEDPRWYVVRNVVHILGWIGGPKIIPILLEAKEHPEPRVRQEVVAVLSQAEAGVSRNILLGMLNEAPPGLIGAILHQLAQERDPVVAQHLLDYVQSPAFQTLPPGDCRAFYMTLGACGGNEILPALEKGLFKGSLWTLKPDLHRRAIARCMARLETPEANEILRRGSRSRRPAVRKACQEAVGGEASDG